MHKRASRSLVGPLIGLTLVTMSALALAPDRASGQQTGTTTVVTTSTYMPDSNVTVTQTFFDKGFTQRDLVRILPLLQDLRDAKMQCKAETDDIYYEMLTHHGNKTSMVGDTRVQECDRKLADRQNKIWATITDRIGSDKANALRNLVEPKTEDVSRVAYTDVYLQRIDTELADLDRMAAARIAANGGTPPANGVQPASVETRTTVTTTTVTPSPVYVTTPAVISDADLVKVVEDRIVANEIGNSDYLIFVPQDRDLNNTDIRFMREGKLKVWF